MNKPGRGGARKGAGRKPKKAEERRVKVGFFVDPATLEWIKREAKNLNVSQGQFVDHLVARDKTFQELSDSF
jgi:hypothetical protein